MAYIKRDKNNKLMWVDEPLEGFEYTSENIVTVSNGLNGDINMLQSEFDVYSQTDEYKAKTTQVEIQENKEQILQQIKDIQVNKLPRAFFEPSDKESGFTWLEFYTNQIKDLRTQIAGL